jgi:ParB family transcriptional regulator, chromosome partitioning protein
VSLGSEDGKPKNKAPRPGKAPVAPGLNHLANRLSDIFETRVKVELGRHKGKIVVEFASLDDLERIVNAMAPGGVNTGRRSLES